MGNRWSILANLSNQSSSEVQLQRDTRHFLKHDLVARPRPGSMGFGLILAWKSASPVQPPLTSNSPAPHCSSSSLRGKVAFLDSATVSTLSVISKEWELVQGQSLTPRTCPKGPQQNTQSSKAALCVPKSNIRKGDSDLEILRASEFTSSHFEYLMKSLEKMEDITYNSDLVRLEKEILVQIERLGALDLFYTCLSRTIKTPTGDIDPAIPDTGENKDSSDCSIRLHMDKIIIPSKRKVERELKRQKASRVSKRSSSSTCLTFENSGSLDKLSNPKRKRLSIARNESEMSKGVMEVARLEKIQANLKEKVGRVRFSMWAEAAGLKEEVLHQQLYYGWHCRDKLLKSTRPLVLYLARFYRGQGMSIDDLLQAGNMGVLQGAERFDHTRGYRFATYAQYWIRKTMSTLLARHSRGIQIPTTLKNVITKTKKARLVLYNRHGRYPQDEDISSYTGISLSNVRLARKCSRVAGSIDQKVGDAMGAKYMEIIPDTSISTPEEIAMRRNMRKEIHDILGGLHQREREVLILRYGLRDGRCKSLKEIGKVFKVSKEWIRKIEKAALTKIRTKEIQSRLSPFQCL